MSPILQIPPELLQGILRLQILAAPVKDSRKTVRAVALVHRSWTPSARYLAFTSYCFIPKTDTEARATIELIKERLGEGSQRCGPCRSLYINASRIKSVDSVPYRIAELYKSMSQTLWSLEIRGPLRFSFISGPTRTIR